ncbi:MAG: hypothetical protein DMG13_20565 [Acidobacteria bacterium]|nr:MAG: hypothetical protein DMG13_20565 [Acidobacteriota bacterium]
MEFASSLLASGFWLLLTQRRSIKLSPLSTAESLHSAILGEKTINDDAVIQQLIEGYLIESQLAGFPGINVNDEEIADAVGKLQQRESVSPRALHDAVLRRMRTARYLEVRFRQFLGASDQDVRKYYDDVFVPTARARGMNPIPALEQVTDAIRKNVVEEQLDHEVSIWLEAVRRRSNIEILK